MNLLQTILLYMSMVFVSSVQSAPEATPAPLVTQAPQVEVAALVSPTPSPSPSPSPTPVPTPNITPNDAYKTIQVRDSGEDVSQLQRRLADLGYYGGDIDGRFGNQTRAAVEQFQYNNGLGVDGIAGKRTLTVLYESKDVVASTAEPVTPTPTKRIITPRPRLETTPAPADTSMPPPPTFIPTEAPTQTVTATPTPSATVKAEQTPIVSAANLAEEQLALQEVSEQPETVATPTVQPWETGETQPTETESTPEPTVTEAPPAFTPLLEAGFVQEGQTELLTKAAVEGKEPVVLVPIIRDDDVIMIPFFDILENVDVALVPSLMTSRAEYAFTVLNDWYLFSCDIGEDGTLSNITAKKNNVPQLMEERTALLQDGTIYVPITDMETWTGIRFEWSEEAQRYTVIMPVPAAP